MKVKIDKYGIIRDVLPPDQWEIQKPVTLGTLIDDLIKEYPDLAKYKYVVAVNDELAGRKKKISDGDQVIFIPPFAGG